MRGGEPRGGRVAARRVGLVRSSPSALVRLRERSGEVVPTRERRAWRFTKLGIVASRVRLSVGFNSFSLVSPVLLIFERN